MMAFSETSERLSLSKACPEKQDMMHSQSFKQEELFGVAAGCDDRFKTKPHLGTKKACLAYVSLPPRPHDITASLLPVLP